MNRQMAGRVTGKTVGDGLALGIDLGGTNLKGAIVSRDGDIRLMRTTPTRAEEGVEVVLRNVSQFIRDLLQAWDGAPPTKLGIGVPGPCIRDTGMVPTCVNIPGWKDEPLREMLEEEFALTVTVENDAKVATFAEAKIGAGRGLKYLVMLTLGTSVGSGIVANGVLLRGRDTSAGELGHTIIDVDGPSCTCGNRGCLASFVGAPAIVERALKRLNDGGKSVLAGAAGDLTQLDAGLIARAAEAGDELAREVMAETAWYLGIGVGNLINIFNPEMVILGGGVAAAGELLLEKVRAVAGHSALHGLAENVKIVPATLGPAAGVVGAGLMSFEG